MNALRCEGEDLVNVDDAVSFISDLRQATDLGQVKIGRNVVVIGGGMTAVDAAVQSKLLGAQDVALVYRRGKEKMSASVYEQELATSKGVRIIYNAQPLRVLKDGDGLSVEFGYTQTVDGKLQPTGEIFHLAADQVFKAIGQNLTGAPDALTLSDGKIEVDENGRTSMAKVWAGGDCATGGDDLTVTAVAQGRDAAIDINTVFLG